MNVLRCYLLSRPRSVYVLRCCPKPLCAAAFVPAKCASLCLLTNNPAPSDVGSDRCQRRVGCFTSTPGEALYVLFVFRLDPGKLCVRDFGFVCVDVVLRR